jgi:hypothetical protein
VIRGVDDERSFYPPEAIEARRQQAEAVAAALRGSDVRVAFEGGMCAFGFYSGLPYLVELTGLTQYWLAKQPLSERGAVGHEKVASDAMLREHGVHLLVSHDFPPVARPRDRLAVDEVYFGDRARARVLVYSDELMDRLRGVPGIDFVPIERTIELSARRMARVAPEPAREIEAGLDVYYFDHAGARGRELREALHQRVEALRRGAGP